MSLNNPSARAVLLFISTNYGGDLADLLALRGTVVCGPGAYGYDAQAKALTRAPASDRVLFAVPEGAELVIAGQADARQWLTGTS